MVYLLGLAFTISLTILILHVFGIQLISVSSDKKKEEPILVIITLIIGLIFGYFANKLHNEKDVMNIMMDRYEQEKNMSESSNK